MRDNNTQVVWTSSRYDYGMQPRACAQGYLS
jgi:hypothetical protein